MQQQPQTLRCVPRILVSLPNACLQGFRSTVEPKIPGIRCGTKPAIFSKDFGLLWNQTCWVLMEPELLYFGGVWGLTVPGLLCFPGISNPHGAKKTTVFCSDVVIHHRTKTTVFSKDFGPQKQRLR